MSRCQPELLWTLVEQTNDPGTESAALLRHVETCSLCQQTLLKAAGDPSWWQDSKQWLRDLPQSEGNEIDPTMGQDRSSASQGAPLLDEAAQRAMQLAVLQPAAHPEMLGRLGRYDIEGFLGQGGMGVVFRGFDTDLQRTVAIKVLSPPWSRDVAARQRFAREAQAAASIAHENVVPIYHVQADHEPPFLVMRYIPGITLDQYVQRHHPLDPATILRIANQLVDGLNAAHDQGLIHRDIKPANVLIGEDVERVWLTDFGLARAAGDLTLTHSGVITGTPHYMSPEQARGQSLDRSSDWFSLGAVLYFLATGHPPFTAENTLAILHQVVSAPVPDLLKRRQDLPVSLHALISKLLEKKPNARPKDAADIRQSLQVSSDELKQGKVGYRRDTRRLKWASICVTTLLCLVLGSKALWKSSEPSNSEATTRPAVRSSQDLPRIIGWDTTSGEGVRQFLEFTSSTASEASISDNHWRDEMVRLNEQLDRLEQHPIPNTTFNNTSHEVLDGEILLLKQTLQEASQWFEQTMK